MIKKEIEGSRGKKITQYIPENEDDVKRLREMNNLDDRHTFADDPLRIPLESIEDGPPERSDEPPFLETE